ncbi:nucleolin 2-like [Xenia sp. Carnegie-2017]|uniref:nucleolin 2-like n=1 Tax=Xenia sp. Carnegie-2017 TaxID=2897299 RepID=UPI001F03F444|nr:nucleolin 2-like [Xenia sp. Carnegie-2017]XP_046863375.1 nucleolin 2-like [Xenia sp. Carnegie-2017]
MERTKNENGKTTADKPNNQNADHQNNVGTTAVDGGHSSSDEEDMEEDDGEAKDGGANVKKTDVGDVREKDGGKIDGNGAFSCKKRGENTGPSHEILAKDKNGSERAIGAIPSQKKTMQTTGKSSSAESFNRKLLKDASNGKISSDSSSDTESEEKNGQKKAQTPKKKIMNTEGKSSSVKKSFTQTGLKDASNGKISSDSSSDTESEEDEKNGQKKAQTPKKKIMNTEGKSSSVKSFTLTGWKDVSDGNSSSDSESEEMRKMNVKSGRRGYLISKAKITTSKDDARIPVIQVVKRKTRIKRRFGKTNDISTAKQTVKRKRFNATVCKQTERNE